MAIGEGKGQWVLQGYDSTTRIYGRRIPSDIVSEGQIVALLQRLVSRHLDADEVYSASIQPGSQEYSPLLEVSVDRAHTTLMCGDNPHYAARFYAEGEHIPA